LADVWTANRPRRPVVVTVLTGSLSVAVRRPADSWLWTAACQGYPHEDQRDTCEHAYSDALVEDQDAEHDGDYRQQAWPVG
jgi:hypothetical protein